VKGLIEQPVNPITVEIIRNSFIAIARQMSYSLGRAAYSPVIYDMKDFSVGIFDAEAQLLGQAPGLPLFLGGLDHAVDVVRDKHQNPEPGDAFLVNDSFLVGSHLHDVTAVSPVFGQNELIGWTAAKAHWNDIGGKDPGFTVDSTEIYQEGIRLGPIRIMQGYDWVSDILDLLMRNSRTPQTLLGDLSAQMAACRMGERRLAALVERFGVATVQAARDEIFAQSAVVERDFISRIPDGVYHAEGFFDSDGQTDEPVMISLKIQVEDGQFIFDLTGSSDQCLGSTNCGLSQTISAARLALQYLMGGDTSPTGGSFRRLQVIAPEGTVVNAKPPAACYNYGCGPLLMVGLVFKALAPVLPERVIAGQPDSSSNVLITGIHSDGSLFVTGEATAIGWGAHSSGDGGAAFIDSGGGDLKNNPVETMETRYPVLIREYRLRQGSGGAGKWRGGLGVEKVYQLQYPHAELTLWFERTKMPGWGLFGGHSGAPAAVTVQQGAECHRLLKVNHMPIALGAIIHARTGGGGGYGPPWERDPQRVLEDVIDGYISPKTAEEDYGVCFDSNPLTLDMDATEAVRSRLQSDSRSKNQ
jgi:N-methylhydantoinase B